MKLSIVTTLYCSSDYVNEFYSRISNTVRNITSDYEIIFVDDGSPDDSINKVLEISKNNSKVRVIEFSRNFGHHKAMMAGLKHSVGDYVFLIDSDLEEEPELLEIFWSKKSPDIDVIYGVQEKRKGGIFERISGKYFYKMVQFLSDDMEYRSNPLTARLISRRFIESIKLVQENTYSIENIFAYAGYKSKEISCKKGYKKKTTYSLSKKIDLFFRAIASTSVKPLIYVFYIGLIISSLAFLYLLYLLFVIIFLTPPPGWVSLIGIMTLLLGLVIFSIGVVGIYISVIFQEVKQRPVIIKKIY